MVSFVLVAQRIEWKPPELQVAGSNPAGDDFRVTLGKTWESAVLKIDSGFRSETDFGARS
jgi:hypothetical protein